MSEENVNEWVVNIENEDLVPVSLVPRLNLTDLEETACFKLRGSDDYNDTKNSANKGLSKCFAECVKRLLHR